ncbi:MAG: hypothetical protein ACRENI_15260 [Gemmatimonadaceae bacterium]
MWHARGPEHMLEMDTSGPVHMRTQSLVHCAAPLAVALIAACGGDGPAGPQAVGSLPPLFHVVGEAFGSYEEGQTAHCQLHLVVERSDEIRRASRLVEYSATAGGHIARSVLNADGSGFGFFADVYYPDAVIRLIAPDSIEFALAVPVEGDGRLWKELAFFTGSFDGESTGSGAWTCAPFDIWEGGYVDTSHVAGGEWRMQIESP